jgi:hypothetical protein
VSTPEVLSAYCCRPFNGARGHATARPPLPPTGGPDRHLPVLSSGAATSVTYPNTAYGRFLGALDRVNAASAKLEAKCVVPPAPAPQAQKSPPVLTATS